MKKSEHILLVAIPKSASTSLMKTLAKLHQLDPVQDVSWAENPAPNSSSFLHCIHSDLRELGESEVAMFSQPGKLYKQHIFPSPNNLSKLEGLKKVVLLRSPKSVCLAYRRGALKNVHALLPEFSTELSENEWMEVALKKGLYSDLEFFYETWMSLEKEDDVLIIYYDDLIINPVKTINQIEEFWGAVKSEGNIVLARERYSRRAGLEHKLFNFYSWLRGILFD